MKTFERVARCLKLVAATVVVVVGATSSAFDSMLLRKSASFLSHTFKLNLRIPKGTWLNTPLGLRVKARQVFSGHPDVCVEVKCSLMLLCKTA